MAEQNREILKVEHLKKYFPVPNGMLHAVDDISFTIEQGKTLGVVGESGCGKSTMGRAILRLHEPTSGKVSFDQKDILSFNDKQMKDMRRDMQIIFQDPFASLNPRMTVSEAIAAPLLVQKIYDRKDKDGIQKRVREIMNMVGLASRLINTYPHELDGGRRQRIGIARALALGQMVEKAPSDKLFKKPMHPYTQALLSAIPIPNPKVPMNRITMKGELTSPINPEKGCRFAKRCPYATDACRQQDMVLTEEEPGHFVTCLRVQRGEI